MSAPLIPGLWDANTWETNYAWEDVTESGGEDSGVDYTDSAVEHSIEIHATLRYDVELIWELPPPQIVPLRNFRAEMGEYRVLAGRPYHPPTLDCAVPIYVSVDRSGATVPSTKRSLPSEIDTLATLRWYADDAFMDTGDTQTRWFDTSGTVAWSGYDDWRPLFDEQYSYQFALPNSKEIIVRPALIFDSALGNNMSTQLSLDPINNVADVEFWLVMWTHPMENDQSYASILDNGDPVQGFHDMPFVPGDSLAGLRQGFQRLPGKVVLWNGVSGMPLTWAQVSSAGRPVLYRLRFGAHPMVEAWGPKGVHSSYQGIMADPQPLAANYVLGRAWNLLDPDTNGGMHLFEVNYFDHRLGRDEADIVQRQLNACYAVSA